MHRYPTVGGGSGVGNSTSGAVPRDAARPELGFSPPTTFPLTSRRPAPLTPYKLKCDQEPLSTRLGQPDYFPPSPSCAEESLSREACQNGYKETVDGIEELRETSYTLVNQSVWSKPSITKFKEAARKRFKELQNASARKRKAGQVYGVPLAGSFLAKSGQFPEQRHSGEDHRKKWIEDLSQHKKLKALADHVPHGLRRRSLFESLIKNEVPFLRATWCIKVIYLNQVRPLSIGMSAGGGDKSQTKRLDLWTKDVLEYLQILLDELSQHGSAVFTSLPRENSSLLPHISANQQVGDFTQSGLDSEDPSLKKKWQYMSRLVQLHFSEGLLHRQQVVEWLIKQLQERDALDAVEALLPLVLDLIDEISTCQTHIRMLVDVFLHKLGELCPTGQLPDITQQPRHNYVATCFVELLCYLLTTVPDSFVALDCFPLPLYVYGCTNSRNSPLNGNNEAGVNVVGRGEGVPESGEQVPGHLSNLGEYSRSVTVKHVADVIQKHAAALAKAVNPASLRKNEGSVIQSLDKALLTGDIRAAYNCIFDEDFCGHEQPPDEWLAKVSPWIKFGTGLSGNVNPLEVFAVRFLCEWAICDFRNCRKTLNNVDRRPLESRVLCRVYMAVSVLCLRMEEMRRQKSGTTSPNLRAHTGVQMGGPGMFALEDKKNKVNGSGHNAFGFQDLGSSKGISLSTFFESPGPIHDLIVAWLDQHEQGKGGFERLHILLLELVKKGLFWSPAYVRQLIVSGVLEKKETPADVDRASRHRRLLQHLPGPPGLMDEDGKGSLDPVLSEALRLCRTERRLALNGYDVCRSRLSRKGDGVLKQSCQDFSKASLKSVEACNESRLLPVENSSVGAKGTKLQRRKLKLMELKQAIAKLLHFPDWYIVEQDGSIPVKASLGQTGSKRQPMAQGNMADITPGCEDCIRSKKQKTIDGNALFSHGAVLSPRDEDDAWWVKKPSKVLDAIKVEPSAPLKLPKQSSRGRPKAVRKLSLAQLAATHIEGSQGASSSHTCDIKVSCPYHKPVPEDSSLSLKKESRRISSLQDLKSISNAIQRLQLTEKRAIATWLDEAVHNLVEGHEKPASFSSSLPQSMRSSASTGGLVSADDRSSMRWQFGTDELAVVVYLLDITMDFSSLIKLLLWFLPKAAIPTVASNSRLITTVSWNKESSVCEITEHTILTYLRRYEGMLTVTNLLPEAFSAGMQRAAIILSSGPGGRMGCLALFTYLHDLYRKYNSLASLQVWENNWKACSDQRLIVEFESLKSGEGEANFTLLGVTSPGIGEDREESVPPRMGGRIQKLGQYMKEIVRKGFQESVNQLLSKEREVPVANGPKDPGSERWSEVSQPAQNVATGLLECIKQHASSAPNGDVQLAAAAASAIVSNAGTSVASVFDANNSYSSSTTSMISSSKCARRVLCLHMQCLRLLKEVFGDRQNRVLESALASEANSVVAAAFGHPSGRAPRPQYQLSPETPDPNSALGDLGPGSNGLVLGKSSTAAASVAALLVSLVLDGIVSLEKITSMLKVKEGLEALNHLKASFLNPNGMSRIGATGTALKSDNFAEVHLFWFRVLIGDCRSVLGGLVAEILGEPSLLAFMRLQRFLPLATVLSPALALFSFVLRSQHSSFVVGLNREDPSFQQLAQIALGDLFVHEPFREVCLQDTQLLYLSLSRDTGDLEYASLLDAKGTVKDTKVAAMVPSRARLFLHAVLDGRLPNYGDEAYVSGIKGGTNQVEELVQVLDNMQPATFHWQWVELRLLLNEQVFMEKLETLNMPTAVEAVQAARAAVEDGQSLSESEKNFTEIILTRLLVRPDAAALYSETLHLLGRAGRALEDYLILQVQWILENNDMLLGRKSLRQQLEEMASRKKFKVGDGRLKIWDWLPQGGDGVSTADTSGKIDAASPEEGEVAEDVDWRKEGKFPGDGSMGILDSCASLKKYFAIEKALADLVLPCLARSSTETYIRFASRLVKQISDLEQQVSLFSRAAGRSMNTSAEVGVNKAPSSRKGSRSGLECGSPGIGRRITSLADSSPPSSAAMQTSLWLRLQFLLPLLPPIYGDRESTGRNMRSLLAPVLLRLLGTRVVQESTEHFCTDSLVPAYDLDWNAEAATAAAALTAGEGLFDRLLSVLYALLSSTWAGWLKQKTSQKGNSKPHREVPILEREVVQRMQADLDHMQLPSMVRARLQAAMPVLAPSSTLTIFAGPPQLPAAVWPVVHTNGFNTSLTASYKAPFRLDSNMGKGKPSPSQEPDTEVDPWTLLEDGTGSGCTSAGSGSLITGDSGSMKACAWLKGAIRVRRTDLTYVGSVDDDA